MNPKTQKAKIIQLDWILKGSVLKQYKQCGKTYRDNEANRGTPGGYCLH